MSDVKLNHPDMRERKQITVKMTKEFAQDLNLLFASYGLTDLSYVVRESVAAQAEYVRSRMKVALGPAEKVVRHEPGKAVLCYQCEQDGHAVCQEV